jgi:putative ABC transport system permease protein
LFIESLVLGLAGCLIGCILAFFGLEVIRLTPGLQVPGEADMSLNLPALLFAVTVSLLTTLFFGLSPALIAVRRDLRASLQTTSVNMSASRGGARIRAGLVVGQVALSMLLLVFAGLMMRSFLAMLNFDKGISTKGLLAAEIHFPQKQYESAESKRAFFDQLLPRVSAIPGVSHASASFGVPMEGGPGTNDVTISGKPHDKNWMTAFEGVSEDYFATLGLQLIRGRLISEAEIASGRRVAVVNRSLVKNYFGPDDPIGRLIKFNVLDDIPKTPHNAYFEIIGVVNDFYNYGLQQPAQPEAYIPHTFTGFGDRSLLVRTSINPLSIVNTLRQTVASVDSNVMLNHPGTVDDFLQKNIYMKPKFRVISFGTCAAIGLGLALIGLFGVMAYSVALQTHDFGVRVALGAQNSNILSLVLRRGLLLVGSGIVLGLIAAALSVRLVKSQLWGVSAFDVKTLVLAPAALLVTGLLACYVPARRAMRIDPMVALRHD